MPKLCSTPNCNTPVFSRGLCMYHWKTAHGKLLSLTQSDTRPAKAFKIAPISKSRAEALKRYRRLRDKYFEEHPVCEFPGCNSKNITLHHSAGRCGSFLTNKKFFKSLCQKHHMFVETNPLEAQKMGLSVKRLDKFK